MPSTFFPFVRRLIIFSLIIGILGWFGLLLLPEPWRSPSFPFIVLFLFSFSLLQHKFLLRPGSERLSKFANRYMLLVFSKLFLYLSIILIYALLVNPGDAIPFMMSFLVVYILFTIFELREMLKSSQEAS